MKANTYFSDFILTRVKTPDSKDAIVYLGTTWSYGKLREKIATYQNILKAYSVVSGDRVVVRMEAEPESIAMALAIMSAGAIFVPIAIDIPQARLLSILQSIDPRIIVCSADSTEIFSSFAGVNIEGLRIHATPSQASRSVDPGAANDAYIIMTSGTTGTPKGIAMTNLAAIAAIKGYHEMAIPSVSRVGSISPLHFDFCIFDVAITLYFGATLVLVPRILAHQAKGFVKYLNEYQITRMHSVPSVWRAVLSSKDSSIQYQLQHLQGILYAAESFPVRDLLILQSWLPKVEFYQSFGHTESMGCSFKKLSNPAVAYKGYISVGKPLLNTEMFVVAENGQAFSDGEVGELYIKGPHLFRGYWRDPLQTGKCLVSDPRGYPGLVFKSGDLVFHDKDGDFYFIGRKDHQVKIAGNRIELPEIDRVINELEGVSGATTVIANDGEKNIIECFVVRGEGGSWPEFVQYLRKEILLQLPRYMLPHKFFSVHSLPLLSNGKIDRASLMDVKKRPSYLI